MKSQLFLLTLLEKLAFFLCKNKNNIAKFEEAYLLTGNKIRLKARPLHITHFVYFPYNNELFLLMFVFRKYYYF